jgi:hypothetical protein
MSAYLPNTNTWYVVTVYFLPNTNLCGMLHPAVPVPSPKPVSLPPIKCAKGDVGVACFVDPCSVSSCKPQPNTVCVPNYCTKPTTYLGNLLPGGGCGAVWINTTTNKTVPCTPQTAGVWRSLARLWQILCSA